MEVFAQNLVAGDVFEVVTPQGPCPVIVRWAFPVQHSRDPAKICMRVGFDLPDSEGHITQVPSRAALSLITAGWRDCDVRY